MLVGAVTTASAKFTPSVSAAWPTITWPSPFPPPTARREWDFSALMKLNLGGKVERESNKVGSMSYSIAKTGGGATCNM